MASFLAHKNVKALLTFLLLTAQVRGVAVSSTSLVPRTEPRGLKIILDSDRRMDQVFNVVLLETDSALAPPNCTLDELATSMPVGTSNHGVPTLEIGFGGSRHFTLFGKQAEYKNDGTLGNLGRLFADGKSFDCSAESNSLWIDCPATDHHEAFARKPWAHCIIDW